MDAIRSLADLEAVAARMTGAARSKEGHWYRGQGRRCWDLAPKLLRPEYTSRLYSNNPALSHIPIIRKEAAVLDDFCRQSIAFFPEDYSVVDKYCLARHHEVPTRLLDWSIDPRVALYFAVFKPAHWNADGLLCVIDPCWDSWIWEHAQKGELSSGDFAVAPRGPLRHNDRYVIEAIEESFEPDRPRRAVNFSSVVPFVPRLLPGRMTVQRARFTHHGEGNGRIPEDYLTRLLVPRESKETLRAELEASGYTREILFPDLDKIARGVLRAAGLGDA